MTLEPLSHDHAAGLRASAGEGELWRTWYTAIPHPDAMETEIERRLSLHDRGLMLPWGNPVDVNGADSGHDDFHEPAERIPAVRN